MNNTWKIRTAWAYALLRALVLLVFSFFLIAAPESMMPGSSGEPARTLALMFASRTILFGVVFGVLAICRRPQPLAWVLFADAILQVFDTAMSFVTHKGVLAIVPAILCIIDIWAGLQLRRSPQR